MQRYASLRQGLVGAWCPSVSGPFGYRLPDLSGYGNHGTLTNMDPPNDWVISGGKGALDFDGSDDYATTKLNQISGALNTNIFSCCLWAFIRSFSNYPVLLTAGTLVSSGATDCLLIETNNTGSQLYVKAANNTLSLSGARTYTLITSLSTNKWYHVAFLKTNSGDNGKLFVNGVEQTSFSGTLSDSVSSATQNLVFGNYTVSTVSLDGQLDDIRIYNRALTEQEIRLLASERGIGLKPERQRNRYLVPALPSRNRSSRFLGFPS